MNNIVFFGTEDFSLISLKALVEANFPVVAVVTKPDSPKGRGHVLTQPIVKTFAQKHNIPVWQPEKLNEINEKIVALGNPTGVLVSYGKIVSQSTLDLFTPGIINVHPSLLPKYRGPSPIESVILANDKETGVSIMRLTAPMDAGPIYKQVPIRLKGNETSKQLYESLGSTGAQILIDSLPGIVNGTLEPYSQDDSLATYCKMLKKTDGVINWNEEAKIIESHIRAYTMWPQSRTMLGDVEVIITSGEVVEETHGAPGHIFIQNGELTISTGVGGLRIISIKPSGKKEMPISAFLSGYQNRLNN